MGNCCGCCKKKKKPEPGAEVEPPKSEPVQVPPVVAQEVPEIRRSFPEIDLNASSDFKSPTGFQSVLKPARPKHLRVSPSVTSIALSPLPHTKYKKQSKEPSMIKDEEPKIPVSDGIGVQESDLENSDVPTSPWMFWKRWTPKEREAKESAGARFEDKEQMPF